MTEDPKRWSQPFAALLGAYAAQIGFGLPSIGGKDSMSGTFQDIDVPPTLVSFAVDMALEQDIITPELKKAGNKLVWLKIERDENDLPVYDAVMDQYGNSWKISRTEKLYLHMHWIVMKLQQQSARWHLVTVRVPKSSTM